MYRLFLPFVSLQIVFALLVGLAGPAHAEVPSEMKYQGYLRDDSGVAIDGSVPLSFAIFAAATGGSPIWSENHGSVAVTEGVFHVDLGTISPLTDAHFPVADLWIETIVDGTALSPRLAFATVPYAFRASVAEYAISGGEADEDWVIDGDDVYRTTGKVGIGIDSPTQEIHVKTTDVNAGLILEKTGGSTLSLKANSSTVSIGSDSQDDVRIVANNSVKMSVGLDGDVGIGTVSPVSKLSVNGDVNATHLRADTNLGAFNTPALGGMYRDNVVYAWAYIRSDGNIIQSFGIESVSWIGTGRYDIYLERSLAGGAVTVTPTTLDDPIVAGAAINGDTVNVLLKLFNSSTSQFQANNRNFYLQVTGRP